MTLPSSGPISLSQIKAELGSSSNSLKALCIAAGFSPPYAMSRFYGYTHTLLKIAAPTCVAAWDFGAHVMDVSVTPNGAPPSGTVWHFTSSLGNTRTCTEPTRSVTVSEPEDGALECWSVHGTASGWTDSDESPQSCANRGNPA